MEIAAFFDRFLEFERSTNICSFRIGSCFFWDTIRFKAYYSISESLGIYGRSQRYRRPSVFRMLKTLPEDLLSLARVLRKAPGDRGGLLVLANARRVLDPMSGRWVDPYTDPVIDDLSVNPIVLESRIGGLHLKPAWTKNLGYYDVLKYVAGVLRIFIGLFFHLNRQERERLLWMEKRIESEFGVRYPLVRNAVDALAWHHALVPVYSWLLRRLRVRTLVIICSYGKEAWIEACRRYRVRTIELQHGTISKYHPGYHYPEGTNKHYTPDEFWAFGEYWTKTASFPVDIRLRSNFGFRYLERAVGALGNVKDDGYLLVISQGVVGHRLSRFIVDALQFLSDEIRIGYKLHPGERLNWKDEYPWLAEQIGRIEVFEGEEPGLYELMGRARWQLGVSSTALYEGMRLGCRTILVELPSVEYMEEVVASGCAVLIKTAADLARAMRDCPEPEGRMFFDKDDSLLADLNSVGTAEASRYD